MDAVKWLFRNSFLIEPRRRAVAMALKLDPSPAPFAASGALSVHSITSSSDSKFAFKVKCSNNEYFRVKPVFGFVPPKGTVKLDILRLAGPARDDKLQLQWAEVPADESDPTSPFRAGAQSGEIIVPLKAV